MNKVILELSMSLDGFVAGRNDSPDLPLGEGGKHLFDWYSSGDTELSLPGTEMTFSVSRASAEYLRGEWDTFGSMVAGRRMFDIAGAWQGKPPINGMCFIVTHTPPAEWVYDGSPFTFVTDGIESAVRQAAEAAEGKNISIASASIAQQCINAGLLDEIHIDLAPVLLGGGVRLFEQLGIDSVELERLQVVEGTKVTHLSFRIVK